MIPETETSIYFPSILIDHTGKRHHYQGRERIPEGSIIISDYKYWIGMIHGFGTRPFKIITKHGRLLYGIRPPESHAHNQRSNRRHTIVLATHYSN